MSSDRRGFLGRVLGGAAGAVLAPHVKPPETASLSNVGSACLTSQGSFAPGDLVSYNGVAPIGVAMSHSEDGKVFVQLSGSTLVRCGSST